MPLWGCTICLKSFARKGDLTRHKFIHTGIKPHICETCGKGFRQFSGLKTHLNVHTRERPYTCGIGTCKKAFGDPSSCTRHKKETHNTKGAYKCVILDCGTRIKRRSTFVTHLRKHGLDPESMDLNLVAPRSSQREVSVSANFASTDMENKNHNEMESRAVSPSSLGDSSGYYTLDDGEEASHFTSNHGWSGDNPSDCLGRANWFPYDTLLLRSMLEQTVYNRPSCHPNDIYAYSSSTFGDPFCFDGILPTVNYPLLIDSHSNLSTLEPFLDGGSDGSQSSWSSPSSTYSVLYATNSDDDVVSLSLADNGSQESLLYNFM